MGKARVEVPASTTNLGPGFDVLGVALKLYNTVEMEMSGSGLQIEIQGEGVDILPRDESNLVYRAAEMVFQRMGTESLPMTLRLTNNIPLARGLGSSGTAAIGGLMAANAISGAGLTRDEILDMAAKIDGHPDNVAASIFGGLVIASPNEHGIACMKILPPKPVNVVLVVPDFHLLTSDARAVLPTSVDLQTAVFNISRTSLLVAALATGDFRFLGIATDDKLHQPYREKLIPGMEDVFQAAKSVDESVAVALSGAGPSIVAFCADNSEEIGESMRQAFLKHDIDSQIMILDIDEEGAVVY
ncbi:homoserine kinase [Candidatus Poribacteria bacterium]